MTNQLKIEYKADLKKGKIVPCDYFIHTKKRV